MDESGDLGFDFINSRPSKHFTVSILATSSKATNVAFKHTVKRTLRNKLNPPGKRKRFVHELKGTSTTIGIKRYAWNLIKDEQFAVYSLTLEKKKLYPRLMEDKDRVYNYLARLVIDQIPFERAKGGVQLVIDRSKGKRQQVQFNDYIQRQLQGRIDPSVTLDMTHGDSQHWPGLQWADLFAWGIFVSHERKDTEWFDLFKEKVRYEAVFPSK